MLVVTRRDGKESSMYRLICLFLFTCTVAVAQETAYLDLATQTIQGRQREPTSASGTAGGVGGGDGAAFHRPPQLLKLTIFEVEAMGFKIGESLVYEVKLENTGDRAIKIPWTPSPKDIEPSKPGPYEYQMVSLAPRLVNPLGQVAPLEAVVIYGSNAPSTMLELAPGHWVRIRAKSRLSLLGSGDLTAFLSGGRNSARLGATWSINRVSVTELKGKYHETFVPTEIETQSINTIPLHIEAGG
jgi:hypothetical protein